MEGRRSFLRDNGLSLALLAFFVIFMAALAGSGWLEYNENQKEHGALPISLAAYVVSPAFGEAVFENWESEFLQMGIYVFLTAFLFQRGSAESKDPDEEEPSVECVGSEAPGPVRRGGPLLSLYKYSLSLAFLLLFLFSFAGHALSGLGVVNEDAVQHRQPLMTLWEYLGSPRFWFESFQNWQSEFLAVLAIVVLSIWLRQDGSPESKSLAAPHGQTGA